jgi:tetratricopeptide (TPR) repeat protein
MTRRFLLLAILAALVAATTAAEGRLHELTLARPAGSHLLYLPSGRYLRAIAPGYREVMADAIYLWSIQYYANYRRDERAKYLEHIYAGVITELDPRYQDPYVIGAMIMALEAHDVEMALRLLDKGMEANPGNWLFPLEAGFYCYDMLGDYERAARYFERAMRIPGVHPAIRRLHASMFEKLGDARTSLAYWLEIYRTAEDDYVRNVAYRHSHDLRIRVDLEDLRAGVSAFEARFSRKPPSLEALVGAGILNRLPEDPEGNPYLYNRSSGEVRSLARPKLRQLAR